MSAMTMQQEMRYAEERWYVVTFHYLGHGSPPIPPPFKTRRDDDNQDGLVDLIYEYVRKHLKSALVDVTLSLTEGKGFVYSGSMITGMFKVARQVKPS